MRCNETASVEIAIYHFPTLKLKIGATLEWVKILLDAELAFPKHD